jgi:hypothetical protein
MTYVTVTLSRAIASMEAMYEPKISKKYPPVIGGIRPIPPPPPPPMEIAKNLRLIADWFEDHSDIR